MKRSQRITAAIFAVFMVGFPACGEMGAIMRLYGYSELMPPSTLLAPGAMVTIESRNPLRVRLVCGPRASLGPNWQPHTSLTASRELRRQSGKTFTMNVDAMHVIQADARFSHIKNVTATIEQPRIVELDDRDVVANLKYRSCECEAAVNLRIKNGYPVTMISSGLMADVSYRVEFTDDANLSVAARYQEMKELAVELGAGTSRVNTTTIAAKGLMWGVKDDSYLSAITLNDIDENTVKRGSRLIDPMDMARINTQPEAPVVLAPPDSTGRRGPAPPDLEGGQEVMGAPPSIEVRPPLPIRVPNDIGVAQ